MHNIPTNFRRFQRICKEVFHEVSDPQGNLRFYPRKPSMSDVQIISLSLVMEALGIDSENLLWSKLSCDYPSLFPQLICRTRFNRRRRRLQPHIQRVQGLIAERLQHQSKALIVDSIPVPVIRMVRERRYKAFRKDFETAPSKGYSAITRSYYIGYKLHVVILDSGVVQQSGLTKASMHDINYLKGIASLPPAKLLLGDGAYTSAPLQLELFEKYRVRLRSPIRRDRKNFKPHPKRYKSMRQMVETFFAQMCDQFNLRRNYATSYEGLLTRLSSKLAAMGILNWINYLNGRKLSQIKHALHFQ